MCPPDVQNSHNVSGVRRGEAERGQGEAVRAELSRAESERKGKWGSEGRKAQGLGKKTGDGRLWVGGVGMAFEGFLGPQ